MRSEISGLALLSAMITPAVLISACGTLIFSTSSRLARIVDRARSLGRSIEQLASGQAADFAGERRAAIERQLFFQAQRVRLIQRSLATLYLSLGIFVGTTISIGLTSLVASVHLLPAALGIAGTLVLFYACVLLIREARLALRAVSEELEFSVRLRGMYDARGRA